MYEGEKLDCQSRGMAFEQTSKKTYPCIPLGGKAPNGGYPLGGIIPGIIPGIPIPIPGGGIIIPIGGGGGPFLAPFINCLCLSN